jgi:hypothetical protein
MDTSTNTKTQTTSPEKMEGDVVAAINKKIDDIQLLLDSRTKKTNEKENEEILLLAKRATVIIEGTLPEKEVLAQLGEIYEKIQKERGNEKEISVQESAVEQKKNITAAPTPEQEAIDIIHSTERGGVPMFISNHTRKVANSLDITILPNETPNEVIEKFKRRLGNMPEKTAKEEKLLAVNDKKEEVKTSPKLNSNELSDIGKAMERRVDLRDLIFKEKQKNTLTDAEKLRNMEEELKKLEEWIPQKQKEARRAKEIEEEKRVVDVRAQIDKIFTPQVSAPVKVADIPAKSMNEVKIFPKKPTISDLILSKLG